MKVLLSFLLVMVMMTAANAPVAQAQSDILESATRLASTVEAAQEGSTIRRLRSRAMAGLGAGLVTAGVALFMRPPDCGFEGSGTTSDILGSRYRYTAEHRKSGCDVAVDVDNRPELLVLSGDGSFFVPSGSHREYVSEVQSNQGIYVLPGEIDGISITESNTWRYTGLAIAGGGAALLWYGLSRVEVPFRVDLTPVGGVLASRSFGW